MKRSLCVTLVFLGTMTGCGNGEKDVRVEEDPNQSQAQPDAPKDNKNWHIPAMPPPKSPAFKGSSNKPTPSAPRSSSTSRGGFGGIGHGSIGG